eukprot:gene35290-47421_t
MSLWFDSRAASSPSLSLGVAAAPAVSIEHVSNRSPLDKVFDGVTRIALVLGMKGNGKTVFINLMVRIVEKYRASHEALPDIINIRLE